MSKIVDELRKTVLVCHNCHGEIHEGLVDSGRVQALNQDVNKRLDGFDYKDINKTSRHLLVGSLRK
jgi:predicted HNH restriction endonuclease